MLLKVRKLASHLGCMSHKNALMLLLMQQMIINSFIPMPIRSAAAGYGGTIAHGFFTLSLLAAWSDEVLPDVDGMVMSVNYGTDRMRFLSPVPVGSFIRARFILSSYDEKKPGEVTLRWRVTVEIKDAEKPALVADWINRRYFSDASAQT